MNDELFRIEKGFLHYKIYKKDPTYEVWYLIGTASTFDKAKEKIKKYIITIEETNE